MRATRQRMLPPSCGPAWSLLLCVTLPAAKTPDLIWLSGHTQALGAALPARTRSPGSIPHCDVASGRVLDRLELTAAGLAGWRLGRALGLEPFDPVRPPRSGMLVRPGEPAFEIADRPAAGPVAVFLLGRRIDHAGNVAGTGQHEFDRTSKELRAEERRFRRRDVIFAGGQIVDRNGYPAEIERLIADHHLAPAELVLEIAVAEIERVIGRRHAGRVGVPVQQVEREGCLALEVVVDDVRPDQAVRTQHIERGRHLLTVEIAEIGNSALEDLDLTLVEKPTEVACISEVDLRGEHGGGDDALVVIGGHVGERDGKQRAADAIAERM